MLLGPWLHCRDLSYTYSATWPCIGAHSAPSSSMTSEEDIGVGPSPKPATCTLCWHKSGVLQKARFLQREGLAVLSVLSWSYKSPFRCPKQWLKRKKVTLLALWTVMRAQWQNATKNCSARNSDQGSLEQEGHLERQQKLKQRSGGWSNRVHRLQWLARGRFFSWNRNLAHCPCQYLSIYSPVFSFLILFSLTVGAWLPGVVLAENVVVSRPPEAPGLTSRTEFPARQSPGRASKMTDMYGSGKADGSLISWADVTSFGLLCGKAYGWFVLC